MSSDSPACVELRQRVPPSWDVQPLYAVTDFQEGPGILAKDFKDSGVPLLRLRNIEGSTVQLAGCNYLDEERVASKWKHFELKQGDLLISTSASLGRVSVVGAEAVGAVAYTGIIRFRSNSGFLHHEYLRAFLSSRAFVEQAERMATGSVIKHFGPSHLRQMAITLPSLREQVQIAELFDALDERIMVLRETNATLEAISKALFKSWFVDFDPVRAKQEGRAPEGMDEGTAALFPDGFEESGLGLVPKGWRAGSVYSLANFINGASYKAFEPNAERRGLPIVKIAELKSGITAQTAFSDLEMPEKYQLNSGDILFSWSGNPGTSIDTFVWSHDQALLNQHIFKVVPSTIEDRSFVLLALKHLKPVFTELARNKQTTGLGHVTVADLKRLQVVKPDSGLLAVWNEVISTIVDQAFAAMQQAHTLSALRDSLLPRLISGQLRLAETEAVVALGPT
ncbi:restriction endonuclease subunit S [Dyella japonica]|uniref:restriction endonuclease subunit S n=1 Tax=Dyella japonica TaxID=231455 RepID=UPI0009E5F3A2|nr:restriction endonuclease subunit S [Dyella japonica]